MKVMCARLVSASPVVAVMLFISLLAAAHAAPPTVTPSPGYDARLQEERAAKAVHSVPQAPVRRHHRRVHHETR